MRAYIVNNSSDQYHDVEIYIRTDIVIRQLGIHATNTSCAVEPSIPGASIVYPELTIHGQDNHDVTKPLSLSYGSIYRIYCDKILSNGTIEIHAAVIPIPGEGPQTRRQPEWIVVEASFISAGRPERRVFTQCLNGKCRLLPKSVNSQKAIIFADKVNLK